jgi:hypothetical protein
MSVGSGFKRLVVRTGGQMVAAWRVFPGTISRFDL